MPQVITFEHRIVCCEIRETNLQSLAQRQENSTAASNVFPSGADLAAHLSPQSYAKPQCTGPQNCRDRKHPDAMIRDFRDLLDNTQDAMNCAAVYSGMREFVKD